MNDCRKEDIVCIIEKLMQEEKENCSRYCALNPLSSDDRRHDSITFCAALTRVLFAL